MARLQIKLFGGIRVLAGDGEPLTVAGRKLQGLLVYLALNTDRPPTRDALAGLLWGDRFDAQARQSLRQYVSRLRKALEMREGTGVARPLLLTEGEKVGLNQDAVEVDAIEFERLAGEGAPAALVEAGALVQGALADGLSIKEGAFDDWLRAERRRFQDMTCTVLLGLGRYQVERGEFGAAIETGRRLAALDPLLEEGHRLLMRAYVAGGQRAQALKQYQACAALLLGDLATEPDADTQRLFAEIRADGVAPGETTAVQPVHTVALPLVRLSERPIIAVLPLGGMGGETASQDYFAEGMTEDITSALTKYRWLSVISPLTLVASPDGQTDLGRVAAGQGANYLVQGSVRRAGHRIRISVALLDAVTGRHIWANRFDRDIEDMFDIQDEITETIAATIEPELAASEGLRAGRKPTESLDAWDCYHLGLTHLYKFDPENNAKAQALLRKAVELDPEFAAAQARLAYALIMNALYFGAEPTPKLLDESLTLARRAAELDQRDASTYFALGRIHMARGEYDQSIAALETAIDLNPCFAQAHCGLGDSRAYAGQLERAVTDFEEAVRLSPNDPYRWGFLMYGAIAHLFRKDHETAAQWARDAVRVPNAPFWADATLVAALGHLDQPEEARAAAANLLRAFPDFTCSFARHHFFYVKDKSQVDHYVDGLHRAGVPD